MNKKNIGYTFTRRIQYTQKGSPPGFYLEDINTKEVTGFVLDENIEMLKKGKRIRRIVEECYGDNSFDTKEITPQEGAYRRVFRHECTGRIKDTSMNKYPFEHGEKIEIGIKGQKYEEGEIIQITIRLI